MKEGLTKRGGDAALAWRAIILVVWWFSVSWLSLAFALMIYIFVQWALSKNPGRYELVIISVYVAFYSVPAGLGVVCAGLAPRTGLSLQKRILGISLLVLCIGLLILHDYLQAKYR
jgi:hypothetical protein